MTKRSVFIWAVLLTAAPAWSAEDYYAGGLAGIATLSGDGGAQTGPAVSQLSSYRPFNGPAVNLFAGRYFGQYVSLQGNFIWNANDLKFASNSIGTGGAAYYSESRSSREASGIADLLVFFRNRGSRLRPYLSAGFGLVHLSSAQQGGLMTTGGITAPPPQVTANMPALRVAVGIDVRVGRGFSVRYSFSETNTRNPLGSQLVPPGVHWLKNFQNLWGFVKSF